MKLANWTLLMQVTATMCGIVLVLSKPLRETRHGPVFEDDDVDDSILGLYSRENLGPTSQQSLSSKVSVNQHKPRDCSRKIKTFLLSIVRDLNLHEMTQEEAKRLAKDITRRTKNAKDRTPKSKAILTTNSRTASDYTDRGVHHQPVECELAEDGLRKFPCPSRDAFGEQICIDDHALCDNTKHCPNGEDEDPTLCMFHQMTMNYFKTLMNKVGELTRTDFARH